MKITMALIADDANMSQEGKLNVLGVFDRIAAAKFPTVHPKMMFVFRMEAGYADSGTPESVRVRLMDEDGGLLFEASGEIVAPDVKPGESVSAYQIFPLIGVAFPKPGSYKFVINVGEQSPHETVLTVHGVGWGADRTSKSN